jgi:hypothetical protein
MSKTPDATIQIAVACEIVDVSRQLRNTWIKRKLVLGRTAGTCTLAELLDLAAFSALVGCLGFEDARVAWHQIRDECRRGWPDHSFNVVADLQLKIAVVTRTDSDVVKAVRHGRPARVIEVGDRLTIAEQAFRRVVAATGS